MALIERITGRTVAEVLEARASEQPGRPFLISGDQKLTYAQVNQRVNALAAALHELGIERGDRIAIDLPNWPEFII